MTARRRKQIAAACHRDAISTVSGNRQHVEVMPLSTIAARTGLTALFLLGLSPAVAAPCPAPLLAEVLAPPSAGHTEVSLACDLALPPDAVVGKRLVFAGKAASGARLDCHGARLVGGGGVDTGPDRIVIRSRGQTWQAMAADRPSNITIRDCRLDGGLRISGLGDNGQAEAVRQSSLNAGHTARAQAAAPTAITLENMIFSTTGRIPLYLAPGVTGVRLTGSTFTGTSNNPAVYLDAESAGNTIAGNRFDLADHRREVIAIDGSADNTIADNTFTHVDAGGIFLYRNCGEGGTVRHQTPSGNVIAGNTFAPRTPASAPAIWIGSRGGRLFWRLATGCSADGGLPFGSSADDGDHADGNAVTDNVFIGIAPATAIRDDGNGSRLSGNRAGH